MRWWLAVLLAACQPSWQQDVVVELRSTGAEPDGALEAVESAVVTWDDALQRLTGRRVVYGSPGDVVIEWSPDTSGRSRDAYGATTTTWDPVTGAITGSHVKMRSDVVWYTSGACTPGALDVEAAVAHELGHALGILWHVPDAGATMEAATEDCAFERRSLDPADLEALRQVYEEE